MEEYGDAAHGHTPYVRLHRVIQRPQTTRRPHQNQTQTPPHITGSVTTAKSLRRLHSLQRNVLRHHSQAEAAIRDACHQVTALNDVCSAFEMGAHLISDVRMSQTTAGAKRRRGTK